MTILGIDPGLAETGWGVVKNEKGKVKSVKFGVIETKAGDDVALRLRDLYDGVKKVIEKYDPDLMGVEDIFYFKNAKSVIKVSQAKGVIMLVGVDCGVRVKEVTPLQVKQAVAGYGRADKRQVQQMVKAILGLRTIPKPDHAADALAVAIAAASDKDWN